MADNPEAGTPALTDLQARLHAVAEMLEEAPTLEPEARRVLAELVDELSAAFQSAEVPPEGMARLTESTGRLAEALRHQHEHGLLAKARDGFADAVAQTEAHAPFLTRLAGRFLELLADLGI
jgi:hypothetical protein